MIEDSQSWIKRASIVVAVWGVLSILVSLFENVSLYTIGIIFIIFAAVIYLTKNFIAIYAVAILLWIIGFMELFNLTGPLGIQLSSAQGLDRILVALINFVIGAVFIYRTWKLGKLNK